MVMVWFKGPRAGHTYPISREDRVRKGPENNEHLGKEEEEAEGDAMR